MKRRTFFTLLYVVLMACFFKGVFMPVNNGFTSTMGAAIILVGTFAIERTVKFLSKYNGHK